MISLPSPTWITPSKNLILPLQEVHIWLAHLEVSPLQLNQFSQMLSSDERSRAERFRLTQHRQRFISGRGILRAILSRYLKARPEQLQFRYEVHGKPTLQVPEEPRLHFNVSHSQDLMLCAVTCDRQVGIDLEQIRPVSDLEKLTQRFFSIREYQNIQALPEEYRPQSFFQHWTCKEAILKAWGVGLLQLGAVEISLAGEVAELIHSPEGTQSTAQWWLQSFIPSKDYVAAIALNNYFHKDNSQHFYRFPVSQGQHCE